MAHLFICWRLEDPPRRRSSGASVRIKSEEGKLYPQFLAYDLEENCSSEEYNFLNGIWY